MPAYIICTYVPEADHYDSVEVETVDLEQALLISNNATPDGAVVVGVVEQKWIEQTNLNMAALTSEIQAMIDKFQS